MTNVFLNSWLDFSSQYGSERSFSYTARNCLGTPSRFPSYGDYPQTYVPRFIPHFEQVLFQINWCISYIFTLFIFKSPAGELCSQVRNSYHDISTEFVDLRFNHPVNAHAIYIYETLNPGSVVSIWGGDCKGHWQNLWKCGSNRPIYGHAPRQFGSVYSVFFFFLKLVNALFWFHF